MMMSQLIMINIGKNYSLRKKLNNWKIKNTLIRPV